MRDGSHLFTVNLDSVLSTVGEKRSRVGKQNGLKQERDLPTIACGWYRGTSEGAVDDQTAKASR